MSGEMNQIVGEIPYDPRVLQVLEEIKKTKNAEKVFGYLCGEETEPVSWETIDKEVRTKSESGVRYYNLISRLCEVNPYFKSLYEETRLND